ncbi:transcription factor HES-2-like [Micropterus dolomieu]|uniref:transcription factor HES-2-like n=1 Tax=Micropterus dolomieu TaxID=147949 RepID=UPI001E8D0594|nr:transcription factor HES-2-like [Micropterus dolomieu]
MKSAEIRFSQQRPLQHRDPTMAPTITAAMTDSQEHLTLTHKILSLFMLKLNCRISVLMTLFLFLQLRKPLDSKLEKADILEMTVCVLRRLQQQNQAVDSAAVDQGYSSCVQEVNHFLSKEEVETQSQRRLVNHFNKQQSLSDKKLREADFSLLSSTVQTSITKEKSLARSAPWRPW